MIFDIPQPVSRCKKTGPLRFLWIFNLIYLAGCCDFCYSTNRTSYVCWVICSYSPLLSRFTCTMFLVVQSRPVPFSAVLKIFILFFGLLSLQITWSGYSFFVENELPKKKMHFNELLFSDYCIFILSYGYCENKQTNAVARGCGVAKKLGHYVFFEYLI